MPEPAGPGAQVLARILHTALAGSLAIFAGLCIILQRQGVAVQLPGVVAYAPLLLAAVMFGVALVIRGRLLDEPQIDEQGWWRANLSRCVLLWSLFEGPALFGAAIYLATGHPLALGATVAGFILLMFNSPDRLRDS
jgi:hypothetical protein